MTNLNGYQTDLGTCLCGDALDLIPTLDDGSVNLVLTSPPFALQRKKEYGNESQENYVSWFLEFAQALLPKLADDGSFVVDLGGAYMKGRPVRSLYNYRLLIAMVDQLGYNLAEEFFWFNPSKLPSPIEWVNKRKIRAKDAVNTVWWFSKSDFPKADIRKVLVPYSDRMKKLIKDPESYYKAKSRPSGHDISYSFAKDNGGAIPPNLLQIPNTESNSHYLSFCSELDLKGHPARFPESLPKFFIDFLTDEGDLVLDIFGGSNTTGFVAEKCARRWMTFELSNEYVSTSVLRFSNTVDQAKKAFDIISKGGYLTI